jgi:hypothetical protein
MRKPVVLHCSFCHEVGHYWPTCPKKSRADELMKLIVLAIVGEEVERVLVRAFPKSAHIIRKASRVTLRAYRQAGGRWTPPRSQRLLSNRRKMKHLRRSA